MAGQPRLLFPGATPAPQSSHSIHPCSSEPYVLLLATFSNSLFTLPNRPSRRAVTSTLLAPVLRETGAGQPFTFGTHASGVRHAGGMRTELDLQRTFQLAPQLQASSRQPGLYGPDVDLQRRCNLFVRQAFDISQHDGFPISATQTLQSLAQLILALVRERFLFRVASSSWSPQYSARYSWLDLQSCLP